MLDQPVHANEHVKLLDLGNQEFHLFNVQAEMHVEQCCLMGEGCSLSPISESESMMPSKLKCWDLMLLGVVGIHHAHVHSRVYNGNTDGVHATDGKLEGDDKEEWELRLLEKAP